MSLKNMINFKSASNHSYKRFRDFTEKPFITVQSGNSNSIAYKL